MNNEKPPVSDEEKDKRAIEKYRKFKAENRHRYKITRALKSVRRFGAGYTFSKYKNAVCSHVRYRTFYKYLSITPEEREKEKSWKFMNDVKFSILVPLYNTPADFLKDMISSCLKQTYGNFELVLADGSDEAHSYVKEMVKSISDTRIVYEKIKNSGISENTNECLKLSTGDYIVLADHDDLLHESALYWLCRAVNEKKADFIYTDEAIFSRSPSKPDDYHMKTGYAPDDLAANNYICHITCFKKSLLKENEGFRKEFDGSQDYDLVLRLTERAENVVHVPRVLYFWRNHKSSVASDISAKSYTVSAGRHADEAHFRRIGINASVESTAAFPAIYKADYAIEKGHSITFIITEHGSDDSLTEKYFKYTSLPYEVKKISDISERNKAAEDASGDIIIFIDGSVRPAKKDWADELVKAVQFERIGAAGPQVLYTDGMLRDLGIVLGAGKKRIAGNAAYRFRKNFPGYNGNRYFIHDVSAVSDTCIAVRKDTFLSAGGFDERLTDWYSGIDLSIRLGIKGFNNVINPYSIVNYMKNEDYRDVTGNFPENNEDRIIKAKWGDRLKDDPYYSPNFSRENTDYSLK